MRVMLTESVIEGNSVKTVMRDGHKPVVYVEGAIVEMSDASARKYIKKGWARELTEEEAKEPQVRTKRPERIALEELTREERKLVEEGHYRSPQEALAHRATPAKSKVTRKVKEDEEESDSHTTSKKRHKTHE